MAGREDRGWRMARAIRKGRSGRKTRGPKREVSGQEGQVIHPPKRNVGHQFLAHAVWGSMHGPYQGVYARWPRMVWKAQNTAPTGSCGVHIIEVYPPACGVRLSKKCKAQGQTQP